MVTFLGMIFGIGLCGLIVGLLAAFIGATILGDGVAGFGRLVGALAGVVIGYPIGVIIGILLINKLLHHSGSLKFGILGVIIGWLAVIGLSQTLDIVNDSDLIFILVLIAPPLFGAIGFHLISLLHK